MFGQKKKPEPSKEEIVSTITDLLREGQSSKGEPDAAAEKIAAGLAEVLFEPPPPLPPRPKPDWVARVFVGIVGLLTGLVSVTFMLAVFAGSVVFVYQTVTDQRILAVYVLSGFFVIPIFYFLPYEDPGKSFVKRRGRKPWRYALFTLIWAGLIFAIAQEWTVFVACSSFVFLTQVCGPWLVEKIYMFIRRLADVLEQAFRRLTGIYEPLELTKFVGPPSD